MPVRPTKSDGSEKAASQDDEEVDKRGYLMKMGGGNFGKWQKRLFSIELSPDRKFYFLAYRMKDKGPVVGQVLLPMSTVIIDPESAKSADFVFLLQPRVQPKKAKAYFLSAATAEERKEWIEALEKASLKMPPHEELIKQGYRVGEDVGTPE